MGGRRSVDGRGMARNGPQPGGGVTSLSSTGGRGGSLFAMPCKQGRSGEGQVERTQQSTNEDVTMRSAGVLAGMSHQQHQGDMRVQGGGKGMMEVGHSNSNKWIKIATINLR